MNITFMIGNGFDRNMGLRTTYSDFIKYYKQISTDDSEIEEFKNHIREHEELWSDAEIEFGAYTGELKRGAGARLSKCHTDFCLQLANYLKKEERRIDYSANEAQILAAVNNLNSIYSSF